MSYRNINVNGTVYKFVIGKKFTKVVGIGSIANSLLGKPIWCSDKFLMEPSDVKRFILGNGTVDPHFHDGPHECINANRTNRYLECGGEVRLRADPFDAEIDEKLNYSYRCEECYRERSYDI